jgi:DNA-binding MarR family transcriptional regulator
MLLDSSRSSGQGTVPMKKSARADPLQLSWEEIGFLSQGLALSSRALRDVTRDISDEYLLGPRGAWIVHLISSGGVFPSDLTEAFHCGRSLITAELNRLTDAGLITYQKSSSDGRRVELTLTPLGRTVERRVKEGLSRFILQRLSAYTREEVLLCARLLRDFRTPAPDSAQPQLQSRRELPRRRASVLRAAGQSSRRPVR